MVLSLLILVALFITSERLIRLIFPTLLKLSTVVDCYIFS
jgi:hypothetical protein